MKEDVSGPRLRILILHQNMGAGHKRVAAVLEDMLHRESDAHVVNVAANDILGSPFMNVFERVWNETMRRDWVCLADSVGAFLTRLVIMPILDALNAPLLHDKLDAYAPDAILSTVDGFNKILGAYATERGIPFQIYITCYSAFVDTVSPDATHVCYFKETANAVRGFDLTMPYYTHAVIRASSWCSRVAYVLRFYGQILRQGVRSIFRNAQVPPPSPNRAECVTVGPLVSARHFAAGDRAAVRKRLGVDAGRDCVLIASGSIGGRFLEGAVEAVAAGFHERLTLLVMCGQDEATRQRIARRAERNGRTYIMTFGFVEDFENYLVAADCAVIRPSGGVFNECMVSRTPVVVPERVTSNDRGILAVVERHSLGAVYRKTGHLPETLAQVLNAKELHRRNIEAFLEGYPQTYEAMTECIIGALDAALRRYGQPPLHAPAEREAVHSG